ncbi:hypothetical protein [Bradyrhizobium liaoningense]|uniref:hypothetical protein n=1 Tax=Bradyrhizobium liaoningense TaxID=43992 RepID=UPI001BAA80A9|nr:hypothetical protein [Bradyrhizobium liaoningense]MBR1167052.1 hypothetical protein [Bradyrhizobium liaoningense]
MVRSPKIAPIGLEAQDFRQHFGYLSGAVVPIGYVGEQVEVQALLSKIERHAESDQIIARSKHEADIVLPPRRLSDGQV